jgi:hypothetical protein
MSALLPAALVAAGAVVAIASVRASRSGLAPEGTSLLRYGGRARTLVSAMLALPFLAAALAARRYPPGEDAAGFWQLAVMASLAFLFLWIGRIEVTGVRHLVTSEALEGHSPWRGAVRVPWGEIASVSWSAANQGFEVRAGNGRSVRVSRFLEGLPALADALEAHGVAVPPEVRSRLRE